MKLSGCALALGVVTAVATWGTASVSEAFVSQLMGLTLILLGIAVWVRSSRWVGVASIPMFGAVMVQASFSDEPSWVRSIILGCLWFITMQVSWEAIERRSDDRYSAAVNARRIQEAAVVVGIALVLGLVASLAATFAPLRSVLLQALVLGALLCGFVILLRHQTGRTSASRVTE